ncbi:recombinase family protein [Nocardia altamirensis]|uniref:recombinase family protein n=1 Tax=Nocardia altamirensis TaxID=472158 RepID=UPI000A0084C2|nr:recombinase family protein [Nocardia altamirensis]
MAASPEQLRRWSTTSRIGVDRGSHTDRASTGFRVAFVGRTSTADLQDPTLSIPRQHSACEFALPDSATIVAYFYDIESGRKELAARGRSAAHDQFDIPVPRDGGIQDLLAEAETPDRRFDYAICESIERISRRTYSGTSIEHRLEEAGVRLLAADEPFKLTRTSHHRKEKVATQVLTRRVKQGVAEFYVLEMLEKSWDGFAVHTEAGYNVGKPCYGYQALLVQHPVPAKRAKGQKKTRLEPHPVHGPVVKKMFRWRGSERLTYQQIADRLNEDLTTNPAPIPVDPETATGHWTHSNVRDVVTNPKHTGHMVWNRRGRKSNKNRINPVAEWVWSEAPVHEPLVSMEEFLLAQEVSSERERSRAAAGPNSHPDTKRSYLFRSRLACDHCNRRMFGKTRKVSAYYVCAPKKGYIPEGHPTAGQFFVREQDLIEHLNTFLNRHVFGEYRRTLLEDSDVDAKAASEREKQSVTLRQGIAEAETKMKRLVRSLELVDDPDRELVRDINDRRAELRTQQTQLQARLAEIEAEVLRVSSPGLINSLPIGYLRVEELPHGLARQLFDALRLEVRYNKTHNRLSYRITLVVGTLALVHRVAQEALIAATNEDAATPGRSDGAMVGTICVAPPAGIEPAT